jgi:hypothetical protein
MASTGLLAGAAMAFGRGGLAGEEKREEERTLAAPPSLAEDWGKTPWSSDPR